jgi:hypothetical protein
MARSSTRTGCDGNAAALSIDWWCKEAPERMAALLSRVDQHEH